MMKKISSICLVLLSISSILSINAFAQEPTIESTFVLKDNIIEEVYGLYDTSNNSNVVLMAAGLITNKNLKLAKTTDKLIITANTSCTTYVKKMWIYLY